MSPVEELIAAIKAGNMDQARGALIQDPNAANASVDGVPVTMLALYYGQGQIAGVLAETKGRLNVFECAAFGRTDQLSDVLAADPEAVNLVSPDGFTALGFASYFGQDEAARMLVDAGADVNAYSNNPLRVAPLHSALSGHHNEIARLLIERGASVDAPGGEGWTPLHYAAHNGSLEMAQILLENGAEKDARMGDGKTPEDMAREAGHVDLAELLETGRLT